VLPPALAFGFGRAAPCCSSAEASADGSGQSGIVPTPAGAVGGWLPGGALSPLGGGNASGVAGSSVSAGATAGGFVSAGAVAGGFDGGASAGIGVAAGAFGTPAGCGGGFCSGV
jgi:hypothetical protein